MKKAICASVLACLAIGCGGGGEAGGEQPTDRPPNIVLIISDDHFWGDHGFMGNPIVQTPNLDGLAAQSMVFTRGYTPASVCRPSLATMVTGLYPHQHGITGNDPPGGAATIEDPAARAEMVEVFGRNETVMERLQEREYVSFQTGKWWEGNPTDHGFTAGMTHGDVTRGGRHGDEGLRIGREGMQPIEAFLDSRGDKPFLLFYAPFLPHLPHNPPDSLLAKYLVDGRSDGEAKYYAMIDWLDLTVGDLMASLDRRGLRENTLILYVVDNGWRPPGPGQGRFDARAKMSPYDAGIRTPIMISWPGGVEPGRDEESIVSTIDLVPTILRAVEGDGAAGDDGESAMQGLPGIDLRNRAALDRRDAIFGELFAHTAVDLHDPVANLKYRYVVTTDGWKLVEPYVPNRDVEMMVSGEVSPWMRFEPELYNVLLDPEEQSDLTQARPGLVDTLRTRLDEWWAVPR